MADDETISQFTAITSSNPERAEQYLRIADGNLENAITLFYENDGADLTGGPAAAAPQTRSRNQPTEVVTIDSDSEDGGGTREPEQHASAPAAAASVESDAAMARRLQEEMYGGGGGTGSGHDTPVGQDSVRAPMARTADILAGPSSMMDWREDPVELQRAVAEQLSSRRRPQTGPPGIFNQAAPSSSIWNEDGSEDAETRRRNLSRATGGASDQSSKSNMLAEMFRPPFDIMSRLHRWDDIRTRGKQDLKWIIVNVQDANIFDCQVLNRDIWKDPGVKETIKEHFIFKQYMKTDPEASSYVTYYFKANESDDAYPHVGIVDPRTGEQVKVWSGRPFPPASEFLMQIHEFLDRYSLQANTRNPVRQPRKASAGIAVPRSLDPDRMTEDEQLEWAMHNSLEGSKGPRESDPDLLTRADPIDDKGKVPMNGTADALTSAPDDMEMTSADGADAAAPPPPQNTFDLIPSDRPHTEPEATEPNTTRIQFRHPGGRVIRRIALADPVQRLYEWLKAEPLEVSSSQAAAGKDAGRFELVFMGRNLIEAVEKGETVEQAGLKNGSVMVEFG